MKICNIFNIAPKYREPIYKLIDKVWDCDWYFGKNTTDIKEISPYSLKNIKWIENKRLKGNWYWQAGVSKLISNPQYDKYIITGEIYCLSTWWILISHKLLYRKKKVYLWSHGWYGREGLLKRYLKRLFFGMSDHVFTYGRYAKSIAISQGFDGNKITPLYNSLNHEKQIDLRNKLISSDIYGRHFGNNNRVLLFIGRLTKVKRLDILMKAVALAKKKDNIYNLVLIGDGEKKTELVELSRQLKISNQVWFYGECYDDVQNAQLIFEADLCVAPGNVGLTALHAMVFGTPVITHSDFNWQMPEVEAIRKGKTGDYFIRNNIESLYNTIEKWFCNNIDRESIRNACYQEIDTNWNPENQIRIIQENMH